MNEELKKKMRDILRECYGVDIEQADCHFSTQNYAFIFPDKPYMIRVSMSPKKTRQEILSELMWVDDLKEFKQTICEPATSLLGNLLEEFEIDGITYRASMFRTARGNVRAPLDMDPMYFICVGELLGAVHAASLEEQRLGMKYKREHGSGKIEALIEKAASKLPEDVLKHMREVAGRVDALPRSEETYGLCHGDFHGNNFFVEANNVWLFDFDGCFYTYYLYDIASFILDCLLKGYMAPKGAKECLMEDILPYFRIGYELHMKVDDSFYTQLPLFFSYRAIVAVTSLVFIEICGVADNLDGIKQMFFAIVDAPDPLLPLTHIRENMAR